MAVLNPVFLESFWGYANVTDTVTGFRSRWGGSTLGNNAMDLIDEIYPMLRYFGSVSQRRYAAFDTPILNGEFCFHAAIQYDDPFEVTSRALLELCGESVSQVGLTMTVDDGRVKIGLNSDSNVILQSPPGSIPSAAVNSIVLRGLIHPSAGELYLQINGFDAGSVTGIDTQGTLPSNDLYFIATDNPVSLTNGTRRVGAIAIFNDNVAIMPGRFVRLLPTADGAVTDFTPDSGSDNFARVNELAYSSVGFVSGSTLGNVDRYAVADMVSPPLEIYAVAPVANMIKIDSGTREISLGVRVGASEGFGPAIEMPATRITSAPPIAASPATGVQFTFAEINSLEYVMEITV